LFVFVFSSGRAETNLLRAAISLSVAVSCAACAGTGGASALPHPPVVMASPTVSPTASPTTSPTTSSVTETGTVYAVDLYGKDKPMIALHHGSPYKEIDVYGKGADKFDVGDRVRAKGKNVYSPPNHWIDATSISASGSPTPTPAPSPTSTPTSRRVINLIVMENYSTDQIIGNSAAPFINGLRKRGAYFSNAHGMAHPSLPNYLVLFSGKDFGIRDDRCPPQSFSGPTLANQVAFGSSAENAPSDEAVCDADGGLYQGHHVPWVYFADAPVSRSPNGDVNFYIPNNCDNMHDSCGGDAVAHGDAWLRTHWPTSGTTILLWDEAGRGAQYASNNVALFIVGPGIAAHTVSSDVDFCAVLKWIELQEHVSLLGCAAGAPTLSP
jgi:phosphatidylinositol-3-phosphatase